MALSDRLQELRKSHRLSQEQLAEKLDVSRQAISKWESGQANPDINHIVKLSKLYEVSTDYILMGGQVDGQAPERERAGFNEKRGVRIFHELPASIRIAVAVLLVAFGIFVVIPILFVVSMELLSCLF